MAESPVKVIRQMGAKVSRCVRYANEQTFYYWQENYAPLHFKRAAFGRYSEYSKSKKRNKSEWKRKHANRGKRRKNIDLEATPAVASGNLKPAILRGPYTFTGTRRMTVRFTAVPRYVNRKNKYSGFSPAVAVTQITGQEASKLKQVFLKEFTKVYTTKGRPKITQGGIKG